MLRKGPKRMYEEMLKDEIVEPHEAAIDFLEQLKVRGHAREVLTPIVAMWVVSVRRGKVRVLENEIGRMRRSFRTRRVAGDSSTAAKDLHDQVRDQTDQYGAWQRLLSESFVTRTWGERVSWGEALVPQHEERITFLHNKARGHVETASRHQAAIKMIKEADVSCLNEVFAKRASKKGTKSA